MTGPSSWFRKSLFAPAYEKLMLHRTVSFTVPANIKFWGLMRRRGMSWDR